MPPPAPSHEDEQEQPSSWRVSGSGREREQYALRRSQFVRSYRLISPATLGRGDVGEGMMRVWVRKARVAGRGAEARARGAVAWWLGRASTGLLGCFGASSAAARKYYYLQHGFP
ncbi:uncharacterized protein LOC104584707 [Brachypodium distachyon]|uniref:Uncharacterized protein n=1 Tax=Brachypodium distachyon TaxID=15368 RepID=I1IRV1_BRADI|nr:uncharacterized protein LOC104584707 [Brachypodium distachyon]KQJ91036.1 hypothetical protein BRADI_4g35230v3 [Brachypodium distachyon]|eukprot:XP_010238373.1 uncharacterized protein LOC104584707 [Brachypodium distachyon]